MVTYEPFCPATVMDSRRYSPVFLMRQRRIQPLAAELPPFVSLLERQADKEPDAALFGRTAKRSISCFVRCPAKPGKCPKQDAHGGHRCDTGGLRARIWVEGAPRGPRRPAREQMAELSPPSVELGPKLPVSAQVPSKFRSKLRSTSAQTWSSSAQSWSSPAKIWAKTDKFGRCRLNSVERRPNLGRTLLNIGREFFPSLVELGQICPKLAEFSPNLVKLGRQLGDIGQFLPNSAKSGSNSAQFCRVRPTFGRHLPKVGGDHGKGRRGAHKIRPEPVSHFDTGSHGGLLQWAEICGRDLGPRSVAEIWVHVGQA